VLRSSAPFLRNAWTCSVTYIQQIDPRLYLPMWVRSMIMDGLPASIIDKLRKQIEIAESRSHASRLLGSFWRERRQSQCSRHSSITGPTVERRLRSSSASSQCSGSTRLIDGSNDEADGRCASGGEFGWDGDTTHLLAERRADALAGSDMAPCASALLRRSHSFVAMPISPSSDRSVTSLEEELANWSHAVHRDGNGTAESGPDSQQSSPARPKPVEGKRRRSRRGSKAGKAAPVRKL
jgi:hypothetical protein